jgi:uncharacterized membrane protein YeaQ/YmgE (transglycosylase-associated protein family)
MPRIRFAKRGTDTAPPAYSIRHKTVKATNQWETTMSIIAWVILGLISGFIASKLVNNSGDGLVLDIILGIVGALAGGFLFHLVGATGVTGLNLWSICVAVIGAVVVLGLKHAIVGRGHA